MGEFKDEFSSNRALSRIRRNAFLMREELNAGQRPETDRIDELVDWIDRLDLHIILTGELPDTWRKPEEWKP